MGKTPQDLWMGGGMKKKKSAAIFTVQLKTLISLAQYQALKKHASKQGVSMSQIVRDWIMTEGSAK